MALHASECVQEMQKACDKLLGTKQLVSIFMAFFWCALLSIFLKFNFCEIIFKKHKVFLIIFLRHFKNYLERLNSFLITIIQNYISYHKI